MTKKLIRCACGKTETIVPITNAGGLTEREAQRLGWLFTVSNGDQPLEKWICPLCAEKS